MNSKTIFGLMVEYTGRTAFTRVVAPTQVGEQQPLAVGEERMADDSEKVRSEDGLAWMEVDTLHHALVGCYRGPEGLCVDTGNT